MTDIYIKYVNYVKREISTGKYPLHSSFWSHRKTNVLKVPLFRKGLSGPLLRCIDASKANCRSRSACSVFVSRIDNVAREDTVAQHYTGFLRVFALSTIVELFAPRSSNRKYPKSYLPFPWSYPSAPLFFSLFPFTDDQRRGLFDSNGMLLCELVFWTENARFFFSPPGEMSRSLIFEALPQRSGGREEGVTVEGMILSTVKGVKTPKEQRVCRGHQSAECPRVYISGKKTWFHLPWASIKIDALKGDIEGSGLK